jgi:transcriptional regulator with XRE-family HTH domain
VPVNLLSQKSCRKISATEFLVHLCMASKTHVADWRKKLNISQQEMSELLKVKRSLYSKIETGDRATTSGILTTLDHLKSGNAKRVGKSARAWKKLDEASRAELLDKVDVIRIAIHHARKDLEKMSADYRKESEALELLEVLKAENTAKGMDRKHILAWIEGQLVAKRKSIKKCNLAKQHVLSARIAGLDSELRFIRNVLSAKNVRVKASEMIS